jgi:DNA-binding NarL/FixJ family response regulator
MQTILIVDDHPLFRAAIRDIIGRLFAGKGWEATFREASSFQEAFRLTAAAPDLDLVTLDICLPDSNDLSGLLRFRAVAPAAPIVVISAIEERDTMVRAMLCGAVGFIPKASSMDSMIEGLQVVLAGGVYLPPGSQPMQRNGDHPAGEAGVALTPRQAAVLEKLVEGKSNKQIARELAISDMTVKVHVTAILRSLGVETRAQAIVAVRGDGLAGRQATGA